MKIGDEVLIKETLVGGIIESVGEETAWVRLYGPGNRVEVKLSDLVLI